MGSRRRQDRAATYFVIGAGLAVVLAVAVLVFALTRGGRAPLAPAGAVAAGPPLSAGASASVQEVADRPLTGQPSAAEAQEPPPRATIGSTPKPQAAATGGEKGIAIRADDLRRQCADNEVATDQKFKNQLLDVTGTVSGVLQEAPFIGITFGQLNDPMLPLLCDMNRQQAALRRVRAGQTITVRGRYVGKTQEGFIGLIDCRIVPGS